MAFKNNYGLGATGEQPSTKTLEAKMDMLNEKFIVYVDIIHHRRFVTKDSPHYPLLKRRMEMMHA